MRPDEKWRFITYQGHEYAMGPDNGCFGRYWGRDNVCVGPVDRKDRYGNPYCRRHEPKVER